MFSGLPSFNLSGLVFIRFYSLYSLFVFHFSLFIIHYAFSFVFRISYFVFRICVLCLWGKSFVGTLGSSTIGKYEWIAADRVYYMSYIQVHSYICTYSHVLAFVFIFVALLILKQIKQFFISRFL